MIEPGMHINAVGGDCPGKTELHADILRARRSRGSSSSKPQSRIEGEIQQMPADFKVAEFADVLKGAATGRASPAEVTIFDSVGFALEDFSALRYLHKLQLADAANRRQIDLVPRLDNPKDLFGLLAPAAARTVKPPAWTPP
jgi:ornithine cyclodeaminase